ncbi:uncharacterized protein BJ171DRAFT_605915 [Polychytrium aggregatum]|uniref:uncharacterized protein n=1 Tax=Polychytrium aggregatum TaxID=110093 RepID=UPI0022FF18DE|nr:uncharacterized protein BJ171DRAFT_605915 [Polychytrium aggregatum]KAI9190860.1 hypothetical protein BJ171DRAFT_605915 [Polychytrium aggregatum]
MSAQSQFVIYHDPDHESPLCLNASSSLSSSVSLVETFQKIGDWISPLGVCFCPKPAECQRLTLDTPGRIARQVCGADSSCRTCTSETLPLSTPSCSSSFSGPVNASSISTAGFGSAFGTRYFIFRTKGSRSPGCSPNLTAQAERSPVFPTCSRVLDGLYAITLRSPTGLVTFVCSSPNCSDCIPGAAYTLWAGCGTVSPGPGSSTGSQRGALPWILSDPALELPTGFPNQTLASFTPATTRTVTHVLVSPGGPVADGGGGLSGLAYGLIAGGLVLLAAVVLYLCLQRFQRRHRQTQRSSPSAYPLAVPPRPWSLPSQSRSSRPAESQAHQPQGSDPRLGPWPASRSPSFVPRSPAPHRVPSKFSVVSSTNGHTYPSNSDRGSPRQQSSSPLSQQGTFGRQARRVPSDLAGPSPHDEPAESRHDASVPVDDSASEINLPLSPFTDSSAVDDSSSVYSHGQFPPSPAQLEASTYHPNDHSHQRKASGHYVIDPVHVLRPATPQRLGRHSLSGLPSPQTDRFMMKSVAIVHFNGRNPDEIDTMPGDILEILAVRTDGLVKARNQRTAMIGLIPMKAVAPIETEPSPTT